VLVGGDPAAGQIPALAQGRDHVARQGGARLEGGRGRHAAALALLVLLDDEALWHAARTSLPTDLVAELEALHLQQQREGLSDRDAAREVTLLRQYERTMLVRAEAVRLVHERGQDVSSLLSV
jgi:hypothetical protein